MVHTLKEFDEVGTLAHSKLEGYAKVKAENTDITSILGYADNPTAFLTSVNEVIDALLKMQKVCLADKEITSPSLISYTTYNSSNSFDFSLRASKNVGIKYKKVHTISINEDMVYNLANAIADVTTDIIGYKYAEENLGVLNDIVAKACEDVGCNYTVSFTSLTDVKYFVADIDDNHLTVAVPVENAIDMSNIPLIYDQKDEFSRLVAKQAYDNLVFDLKLNQTVVQFMKANDQLIVALTGGKTKVSASNLLRGTYHKKARYVKEGAVGYVSTDSWFALLRNDGDGKFSVVLSPFDKKSLLLVDLDPTEALDE